MGTSLVLLEVGGDTVWAEATRQGALSTYYDIQDRWIDNKEAYDKEEQRKRDELLKEQELAEQPVNVDEDDEWERALRNGKRSKALIMSDDEQVEENGRLHVQRVSSMAKNLL